MENLSHKKILVIYTGGTIGMVATEHGYDVEIGYLSRKNSRDKRLLSS